MISQSLADPICLTESTVVGPLKGYDWCKLFQHLVIKLNVMHHIISSLNVDTRIVYFM